jgi:hypothetical protein
MKGRYLLLTLLLSYSISYCQEDVEALKDKLNQLASESSNTFFSDHCRAFLSVIDAKGVLTDIDIYFLTETYATFSNPETEGNPSELESYTKRQRPFIISWVSPTDGAVSFSLLKLPLNWDPAKSYPLYIGLHGLWSVADNPIEYLTYPFREDPSSTFAFEDGYYLSPWGRGNLWYEGISETDIWECIASFEKIVKIDPARKYLTGHSMGGYGAWCIGMKSVNTWAALGIRAGALWYDPEVMNDDVFETLKDLPVYFVVGNMDGLYNINYSAYQNLLAAGNENTEFVTFEGGHESLAENVEDMYLWIKNFTNDDWKLSSDQNGKVHSLHQSINCFPNPVLDNALLICQLEQPGRLVIDLYDMLGRKVKTLVNDYTHAGEHNLDFDATDLPSGTYTCILKVDDRVNEIKIVIVK